VSKTTSGKGAFRMDLKNILFEKERGIATVSINRPKAMNALNGEVIDELEHLIGDIKSDDEVKVVVVTGAGAKAFVAGADIAVFKTMSEEELKAFAEKGKKVFFDIENLGKPVICAVNGMAFGGGCELAMSCHVRIASESALFGLPEPGLGLIPGFGGTQRLPRLVGRGKGLEMMLTGDNVKAGEALNIGLVEKVVPLKDLRKTCIDMAEKIMSKAPLAIRAILEAVNGGMEVNLEDGCKLETRRLVDCYGTEDRVEGVSSFLEKRKPEYKGK